MFCFNTVVFIFHLDDLSINLQCRKLKNKTIEEFYELYTFDWSCI